MNPLMEEIFSTIVPSAPYVIAAYVLIMVALFVFLFVMLTKVKKAEKRLDILEEAKEENE